MGKDQLITFEGLGRLFSLKTVELDLSSFSSLTEDGMLVVLPLSDFEIFHLDPENGEILTGSKKSEAIAKNKKVIIHAPRVTQDDGILMIYFAEKISGEINLLELLRGKFTYLKNWKFDFTILHFTGYGWDEGKGWQKYKPENPDITYFGSFEENNK